MGGDENDRDGNIVRGQSLLQIEATHPTTQVDVQDQAGGQAERRRAQKILRRPKSLGGETGKLNQPTKRSADRGVVVNDGDQPWGLGHGIMALEESLRQAGPPSVVDLGLMGPAEEGDPRRTIRASR